MRLCIVRTPQDDDNSLPKLLARSGAPASGRAQGPKNDLCNLSALILRRV
jgi:hypothetical protein